MPQCKICKNTDDFVEPSISWDHNFYEDSSDVLYSENVDIEQPDDSHYKPYCYPCGSRLIDWEYPYLDMPLVDTIDIEPTA